MIVELLAIFAPLAGGALFLRAQGLRGWGLAPLGFLAGLFIEMTVACLQLACRLPTTPIITLGVTLLAPTVWWLVQWRRGREVGFSWRVAIAVTATVAAAVTLFRLLNATRWHVDSLVYLNIGELLVDGHYYDSASNYLLAKRLIGVPYLHAPAALVDETYLRSIMPLMAVAIVGAFVWIVRRGLAGRIPTSHVTLFAVLGATFLVTANRFVFHALYINGHLFVGGAIMIIAAVAWLLARDGAQDAPFLLPLATFALFAVVVTRPEGAVYCVLALAPVVLSSRISLAHRRALVGSLAIAAFVWFGTCVSLTHQVGVKPASTLVEMLALSLAVGAVTWLVGWRWLARHKVSLLRFSEIGLWLVLAAFTARSSEIFTTSAIATAKNTVYGKWGLTLIMTAMLVIGSAIALRAEQSVYLRYAVTTFLPMALVLAYVRGGPYRVGHFDSLNRMWLQVLPLAVLYVTVAIAEGEWRLPWPAGWRSKDASVPEPPAQGRTTARSAR